MAALTKKWLKEGEKTTITEFVREIAESIEGDGIVFVGNAARYIRSIAQRKENSHVRDRPDFRQPTADDLLKKQEIVDCIGAAMVLRALCIAKNIPAIFVETLQERWLSTLPDPKNPKLIQGHIFVDAYVGKKWHTVDPLSQYWLHEFGDYSIQGLGRYIPIAKGMDSKDIGFDTMNTFIKWVARRFKKAHLL